MENTEILAPKEVDIKVGNKVYQIKKFSLMQLINLSRFFVALAKTVKIDFKEGNDNMADLMAILSTIEEEQAVDFFSILVNSKDKTAIKEDIISDAEISTQVIATICEVNDFSKLFGNFQKAGEKLKGMTKKTTDSLPSSQK